MCFDKLYTLVSPGMMGGGQFRVPIEVEIPVEMLEVDVIHKVAIQVAFGRGAKGAAAAKAGGGLLSRLGSAGELGVKGVGAGLLLGGASMAANTSF